MRRLKAFRVTHTYRGRMSQTSPGILQLAEPIRLFVISSQPKPNHRPEADKVLWLISVFCALSVVFLSLVLHGMVAVGETTMVGLLKFCAWFFVAAGAISAAIFWPTLEETDVLSNTKRLTACLEQYIDYVKRDLPHPGCAKAWPGLSANNLKSTPANPLPPYSYLLSITALLSGLISGLMFGASASLLQAVNDIRRLLAREPVKVPDLPLE